MCPQRISQSVIPINLRNRRESVGPLTISSPKRRPTASPVGSTTCRPLIDKWLISFLFTRTLVTELNPPILREHGLAAGLKWLTESMTKHDLVVSVTVEDNVDLPDDHAVLLFHPFVSC